MKERKPQFSYVATGPQPPRAGPSKESWAQTEAQLDAPSARRAAQTVQRRAEKFQAGLKPAKRNR